MFFHHFGGKQDAVNVAAEDWPSCEQVLMCTKHILIQTWSNFWWSVAVCRSVCRNVKHLSVCICQCVSVLWIFLKVSLSISRVWLKKKIKSKTEIYFGDKLIFIRILISEWLDSKVQSDVIGLEISITVGLFFYWLLAIVEKRTTPYLTEVGIWRTLNSSYLYLVQRGSIQPLLIYIFVLHPGATCWTFPSFHHSYPLRYGKQHTSSLCVHVHLELSVQCGLFIFLSLLWKEYTLCWTLLTAQRAKNIFNTPIYEYKRVLL